jgi:hypothetical protein
MIRSQMTAIVTAGAIALTSFTAPAAQAGGLSNFEKFLFGATALVVIGSIASNNTRARPAPVVVKPRPYVVRVKPKPKKVVVIKPPRVCLRQRYTRQGWKSFYSGQCLRRYGFNPKHYVTAKH